MKYTNVPCSVNYTLYVLISKIITSYFSFTKTSISLIINYFHVILYYYREILLLFLQEFR